MKSDLLVSIIVPVFNGEEYIARCINSLKCQTYTKIEIIVINDGSDDNTASICEDFAKQDARIKLYNKQNGGVSSARNYGLDIAKGNYIIFVDSDDYVEYNLVEEHVKNIQQEEDIDISVCGFVDELINGEEIHRSENVQTYIYSLEKFESNYFIPYVCWQMMFDRKLLNSTTYFDENISIKEDMLFIYQILMNSKKVAVFSKILYHSIHRENSLSHSAMLYNNVDRYLSCLIAFEKVLKITQKNVKVHKMLTLAILKDITKVREHLIKGRILTFDREKRIDSVTKLVYEHISMHKYTLKEKIIVLLIKFAPQIYIKLANK